MYFYPPPTNPLVIPGSPLSPMIPGGGPFQPFKGGPWFRVVGNWELQIYANGVWTNQPQSVPNRTLPTTPPPMWRTPPIGPRAGVGVLAAVALYDSIKGLYDAIEALRAEEEALAATIAAAEVVEGQLLRTQLWQSWIANDPLGQQFQGTYNCIQSNIVAIQDQIDVLVDKTSPTMADYAHLAVLKHALAYMVRSIAYYRELRDNHRYYGGPIPSAAQVESFVCHPIPLEVAPFPTTVTPQGEMATVPDNPPTGSGPLYPGSPYPKVGPLFPNNYDPGLEPSGPHDDDPPNQ